MRSKALSFLLSLSLMFCVGFGSSLTASAATVSPDSHNEWFLLPFDSFRTGLTPSPVSGTFNSVSGMYNSSFTSSVPGDSFVLSCGHESGVFPILEANHTYLFYFTFSGWTDLSSVSLTVASLRPVQNTSSGFVPLQLISSFVGYLNNTLTVTGFYEFTPSSDFIMSTASGVYLNFSPNISINGRCDWAFYALDITESSESEVNQIITAIQDQTSDIQQSIEDQYGGDPGSSFPVEDIITQHNEKMGVLSFSSEALMQVLGLLSPDQTLSSELVFPSMSLTIAGQRNSVQLWPEYRFDLNTLKQHWPDFVVLMQSLTSALVWIFVLRYCYRVFEKYFLAGGGS